MSEEIKALLEKAGESIKAAKLLLSEEHCGFASGRGYYAMFYVAEALLLSKELAFSKHAGVISAFGKHFIKTNILDHKFHRYLLDAYEYREIGDYEPLEKISRATAEAVISHAEELLAAAKSYLKL
ncbi:HEPN domain-containing protein [Candidatus Saganbacteria bacterium]|nr:HEPN domain-containing protein [Candidatus Saganbacteria bacterium]